MEANNLNTNEFLKGQKEYIKVKEDVINNAINVKNDVYLFNKHSEQVLEYLKESINHMFVYYSVDNEKPTIPNYYNGNKDVIQFLQEDVFTKEEFVASMVFNIVKYTTRLGRKTKDTISDLNKIYNYYTRLKEGIKYYENESYSDMY